MNSPEKKFIAIDFATQNIPLPIESKNLSETNYVSWGLNNTYPNFLLDLYNQSAVHSAIINQKTTYIVGGGLKINGDTELDIQLNASDSIGEFTSKIIKDYLLFNAFAVEVVFNVFGKPVEFHHIPLHKIRTNKSKTKFWFSEDWLYSKKPISYDRYNNKIENDGTSKVFYFDGYFPSVFNVYPMPEYAGTVKSIVTDIAIKDFNLNNIKNHFSPSTLITFFRGSNPPDEAKREVYRDIETYLTGERGKKYMIDFQDINGKAAEIEQLSANDWDKAYVQVAEANLNDIMIGHAVQNPSLFGIKTAGQLGTSQELEVSYEMFKNNYIEVKRGELEIALNQLFIGLEGIKGKLQFADKPLFNQQLKDETKLRIYTINELREIAGLQPLADGDRLLDAAPVSTVPAPTTPIQQEQQSEEVKKKSKKLTEDDYELIKHLGNIFEDFDVIEEVNYQEHKFSVESDIADYVLKNDIKGLTLPELVDVLKNEGKISITEKKLKSTLDKLSESGVINIEIGNDERIKITPPIMPEIPDTGEVTVMYQYQERPNVPEPISGSRSFCKKLMDNNRLYTRADIQEMAAIFGYDIFKFCGGWYFNPQTEETTPYCRHRWVPLRVKRKS